MKSFIVAYDVFDKKRLRKVKKIVYVFAIDGQKSAREVYLNANLTKELVSLLLEVLEEEDKLNIIQIKAKPILLGKAKTLEMENEGIIIL
jgi:CRISPR-associated endonuclease Cas2